MARKMRKDSTTAQLAAAQAEDRSTVHAPRDVPGCNLLTSYGCACYDKFFRTRSEWSLADLLLIAQAAQVLQRMFALEASILPGCEVVTDARGTTRLHPAIAAIDQQRRLLQTLLRDAGMRLRDQHKSSNAPPPEHHTHLPQLAAPEGPGFEEWLL